MDEIRERIADMTQGMDFERKPRATKKEKEDYAAFADSVAGIKSDIDKLSLRLWHACNKNDYRSLPVEEAKQELKRIKASIDEITDKEF